MDRTARTAGVEVLIGLTIALGLFAVSARAGWWALLAVPALSAAAGRVAPTALVGPLRVRAALATAGLTVLATLAPASAFVLVTGASDGARPIAAAAWPGLVAAAAAEEWFFRGWVQERLSGLADRLPRRAIGRAELGWEWLLAAVAFAAAHAVRGGASQAALVFLPGLLLGWCRSRTGAIWAGLLLHVVWNAWALALGLTWAGSG